MTNPADRLRQIDFLLRTEMQRERAEHCGNAAALLDEAERALRNAVEALLYGGPQERTHAAQQASATLAKLRGEQ